MYQHSIISDFVIHSLVRRLLLLAISFFMIKACADPEGRGTAGSDPHLENHIAIGLLSNSGPDPLENHKAAISQDSESGHHGPMMKWRVAGGGGGKHCQSYIPSAKTFWIRAWIDSIYS